MRMAGIVLMFLVCMAQTACVTHRETIPPETRAELIRLGDMLSQCETHDALRAKLLPQVYSLGFLNPDVEYFE